MNINKITTTSFNANPVNKLIPLSEYKGTILKLTKHDKEKIKELETKIAQYEIDIYHYVRMLNENLNFNRDYYNDKIYSIEGEIDTLREMISDIKKNRIKIQNLKKKR